MGPSRRRRRLGAYWVGVLKSPVIAISTVRKRKERLDVFPEFLCEFSYNSTQNLTSIPLFVSPCLKVAFYSFIHLQHPTMIAYKLSPNNRQLGLSCFR